MTTNIYIIYDCRDFVVCRKPAGMLTLPAKSGEASLIDLLAEQLSQKKRVELFPIHRLDRTTEGIVVFAKKKSAAAKLSAIFAEHKNKKEYLCVVHGIPEEESDTLTDLLYADKRANKAYIVDKERKGVKKASLCYEVLATATHREKDISLLRVGLFSGRMHQIRAQLSHRGHALLGDGKYGSRENACTTALFAERLAFSLDGEEYEFSLPYPDGFPWDLFEDSIG